MRFILFIALFAVVIIAFAIMLSQLIREAAQAGSEERGDLPQSVKRIAYVALIIVMFGICAGVMGGV